MMRDHRLGQVIYATQSTIVDYRTAKLNGRLTVEVHKRILRFHQQKFFFHHVITLDFAIPIYFEIEV